jgi:hypothetical protein
MGQADLLTPCRAGPPGVLGWRPTPRHDVRARSAQAHGLPGRVVSAGFQAGRRSSGQMDIYT